MSSAEMCGAVAARASHLLTRGNMLFVTSVRKNDLIDNYIRLFSTVSV